MIEKESFINRTPKITLLLYFIGIGIIVSSAIRWYIVYPDYSNLILAEGLGISVLIFGYIYSWMKETERALTKIIRRTDGIVNWWMKREHEATVQQARGEEE